MNLTHQLFQQDPTTNAFHHFRGDHPRRSSAKTPNQPKRNHRTNAVQTIPGEKTESCSQEVHPVAQAQCTENCRPKMLWAPVSAALWASPQHHETLLSVPSASNQPGQTSQEGRMASYLAGFHLVALVLCNESCRKTMIGAPVLALAPRSPWQQDRLLWVPSASNRPGQMSQEGRMASC